MAKDGDIIEALLGWIFELIGWIFKMLIQLVVALIGGLFSLIGSGIKALFNKNQCINEVFLLTIWGSIVNLFLIPWEAINVPNYE